MGPNRTSRGLFRAYVDETGDRGTSPKSSPFFCFCAVIVRDRNDRAIRECLDEICEVGNRPRGSVVKWRKLDHLKRRYAVERLARLPVRLIYVVVPKATLSSAYMARDHGAFYNFAARLLLERISFLVHDHGGVAKVTFEKVRGFPTYELQEYVARLRRVQPTPSMRIRWSALHRDIAVDSPGGVRGLCAADIGAGALDSAVRPDPNTGLVESSYLETLAPRVVRSAGGQVLRYGLKVLAPDDTMITRLPWWPGRFAPQPVGPPRGAGTPRPSD